MSANGSKPKFAMYWAAGCGGCDIAVLNIHEQLLEVDANFEVAFWPVAMDAKVHDVEALPDGAITMTFFNGGIRTSENEEMARLLRRKSQVLVAFGACASLGSIPGLANLSPASEILDTACTTISTDNSSAARPQPGWEAPEGTLRLPEIYPALRTLDQVVAVDYYVPGCPPESHQISAVIESVVRALHGEATLPPPGSTLGAGVSTVCEDCPRARNLKQIKQFTRIQALAQPDLTLCLLEQGIPCNGPATRSGCGALCPAAGAQCIGCYGPAEGVLDAGARLIAALASVIDSRDPAEIERILDSLPDPAGQFYRFSLAKSLLRGAKAVAAGRRAGHD